MNVTESVATDTPSVGQPLDRMDGRLKVTGGARYSAEMPVADSLYGVLIMSTIAKGRITAMDTKTAEQAGGVHLILTPFNAPKLPQPPSPGGAAPRPQGRKLSLLQNDRVYYNNQPIGVVVADTLEQAIHAAALVRVTYDAQPPVIDLHKGEQYTPKSVQGEEPDKKRGDLDVARQAAKATVAPTYTTPMENHNPMEPHATLAFWEGPEAAPRLTVYDATQGVFGVRGVLASTFQLPPESVRCVAYFIGGGFGCKGSAWSHVALCAMAARQARRPVKLALSRAQMYGSVGYRPVTEQKMLLAADAAGQMTAVGHAVLSNTSTFDEFIEPCAAATRMLYASASQETSYRLSRIDVGTPTFMRAPGESSGTWALEATLDELAYALPMDPIVLRLKNYAEKDPGNDRPFSEKSLRECYQVGAERFGWAKRTATPRSMRAADGRLLGMGMATATYPARRSPSSALARVLADGTAYVQAGTQDIGTGTYTIMAQIAADALGLPVSRVRFELGDTRMPPTPNSGGSQTAASTGSAVREACLAARQAVILQAISDTASPLHGLTPSDIDVQAGKMIAKTSPARTDDYSAVVKRGGAPYIEATMQAKPGEERNAYSMHSFGAVFVEVLVDPDLAEVRLSRCTGVYDVGTVLNEKTARSQLIGGIVFGAGMALTEETLMDPRTGRVMNADLAEYHVPVHADIPEIDVAFVKSFDPHINPLGARGIGEIGITGVVAAIGNAVYHATGVRVRDLPITLDKVMS